MIRPIRKANFLISLVLLSLSFSVFSQQNHSIEAVKAAYIFNFLKYIEWPNEKEQEIFRIGFIGNDKEFLEQCLRIQDRTIRKKAIVVHHIKEPDDNNNYQVIITSKDRNFELATIARFLYGSNTLLISDDAEEKQITMLNFTYPNNERVGFEVNRHNMIYEELKVSSDILLLGGTELDIANLIRDMENDLYKSQLQLRDQTIKLEKVQKQVSLREEKLKKQAVELQTLQGQVTVKEQEINKQNQRIQIQTKEFESQKQQLEKTKASLNNLRNELNQLDTALKFSREELESNSKLLTQKQREISAKETSIDDLAKLINQNKSLLEEQNSRIRSQAMAIEQKEKDIATQSEEIEVQLSTIKTQSNFLAVVGIALVFVLILALFIYRSNRAKHKANHKLAMANLKLEEANNLLRDTQGQLVESEKMAALGGLVAGVAHEINTPLGVSVTAASHLIDSISGFDKQYKSGSLKRSELESMLEDATESTSILIRNLNRASDLIGNFKQVAADQTAEELREFELNHYLEEVCQSLMPKLKQAGHKIDIDCPEIPMSTYPGALAQVMTNLVMNSMVHGFENRRNGLINISAHRHNGTITILYKDDGIGIKDEQIEKIFDPFYTTKRSEGGTGLGMHICYNLVNQKLHGTIVCVKTSAGASFKIDIPTKLENKPEMT